MIEFGKFGRVRTALLAPILGLAMVAGQPAQVTAQPSPARAARASQATAKLVPNIETWTLENGLQVAFVKTDRSPALAVQVWYRAGSKNEPSDRRGTAHMFEHLMFKGLKASTTERTCSWAAVGWWLRQRDHHRGRNRFSQHHSGQPARLCPCA